MKAYKRYMVLWVPACVLVLLIAFFALRSYTQREHKYHIIYIPKVINENVDFWMLLIEGVEMAAQENKAEVTIVAGESENDYQGQNELILWAIEQKPDAILLSPCSYTESTEYVKKIKYAGIPVVLIDSEIDENIADALVATDNVRMGEVEGKFMKQFVTEESRIAIVGHVKNSSTALDREKGVRRGLAEDEDRIVDVVFCDSDYDKAYDLMMELIGKDPGINLVAGLNENSAVGAARAIKEKNLEDKIKVVGIDSSLEQIQLLEEGIFTGIVIQNPFKMGYMGMETALKILNGEPVPKRIDSGCELITREEIYTEENQKLLFPFKEE